MGEVRYMISDAAKLVPSSVIGRKSWSFPLAAMKWDTVIIRKKIFSCFGGFES